MRNPLTVQWLGLGTFTAGAPVFHLSWGTKTPQAMWCGEQQQQKERKTKRKSKNIKIIPMLLITGAGGMCPEHRSSGLRLTASL